MDFISTVYILQTPTINVERNIFLFSFIPNIPIIKIPSLVSAHTSDKNGWQ